jgi:MYXO-CTERM domain-containing protein
MRILSALCVLAAMPALAETRFSSPAVDDTLYTLAPTFSGFAAPGEEIVVWIDGERRAFGRADETGSWTAAVSFAQPLSEGLHLAQAGGATVRFIARRIPAVTCSTTASPSALAVLFGLWAVRRRRQKA